MPGRAEVPNNAGSLAPIPVSAPEGSQLSEAGRGIFSEAEAICLTCSGVWVRALFAYGTRSAVQRSTMPVGICIGGDPFFIAGKNSRREIRKAAETLNFRIFLQELSGVKTVGSDPVITAHMCAGVQPPRRRTRPPTPPSAGNA